jgi:hypothetical protein
MTTERPCSQERWDQTPVAVQDDIRGLEARVTALEAIVQRLDTTVEPLTERRQHTSRTSVAAPVERSPPGDRATATSGAQWASAWRATWPRGAHAGVGAGRRGWWGARGQAGALPALPAPMGGRGSRPSAASGHGHPPGDASRDGVSTAPVGLPRRWRREPGGVACGCASGWLWAWGAGDRGAVPRGLAPGQADHPARARGSVRRLDRCGHAGELGAHARGSFGPASGAGTGLGPDATGGRPGRNRLA